LTSPERPSATSSATINIAGFAEKGGNVELYKDGKLFLTKKVDAQGDFLFSQVELNSGPNTFWTVAFLKESAKSEPSKKVVIIRDETAPSLTMINPSEDKLTVDVADFDVIGKTEPGVSVSLNNYVASVNDKGEFKLKLQLSPGKNEYEVKAKDLAGNITTKKITITYDI
jgi:bacillopeptidase F